MHAEIKAGDDAGEAGDVARAGLPGAMSHRAAWYTVDMTAIVGVMSQIDRGVLSLFVQPIKRDYHLTDTQVSFLLGFAFTFFYAIGGPVLSSMADRGVRKTVIAGCLAVWSLATALSGLAQGFWGFFASRAVVGATEAGCGPASMSMIADAIPKEKLPRAYAIYTSGFLGGTALSLFFGGLLLNVLADVPPIQLAGYGTIHNWQLVFFMLGAPGLLIALIFLLTVQEPQRKGVTKAGGYSLRDVIGYMSTERRLHFPLVGALLLMGFQTHGLNAWMPAFYERTYGWGPATVGMLMGVISLVASTLGLFAGARLAESLGHRRDDANMFVLFLAQTLPIPLLIAAPLMPTPQLALGMASVGSFLTVMGGAGFNTAINLSTPNQMRSQIVALYFILQNAVAGSLGPTLVALATDFVAHSEADLRYVIVGFRIIVCPLTTIFLWYTLKPYAELYRRRIQEGAID
ncbi:MFS transporter [Sphingobium nicotianae]|uniref:MFS transporter n=1 Tax=Sphingobium nicotianae TaxID=2782607 RepID=A0A9X1DAG2_9SPHN|nr:MFS transporter [Sphingobium nicotianae]MBT2186335.1 MFS transporter [Sphingobium nicotianae]